MTINYTTLLGLAKPVTGTESGEWGDVVNDQITSLVEDAIANAASISVTAGNVTLTDNNGTSDQARMAILLVTGSPGVSRNIVAPSTSKWYIVKNGSNAEVVLKGSATTGVTIPAGAEVLAFWNGSDFEVTSMVGPSTSTDNAVARFDGTTGKVVQNSSVVIDDSNNITGIVDETLSGNLNFTGTAKRITGDFSNATIANRVIFKTSTVNGQTSVSAIPDGTGTIANFAGWANSDTANGAVGVFGASSSSVSLSSTKTGTASFLPITFNTSDQERMRIDTSGNVGIGTNSPQTKLHVSSGAVDEVARFEGTGSPYISLYDTNVRQAYVAASASVVEFTVEVNKPLAFATNSVERMRISAVGFVGINQTPDGNARFQVLETDSASRRVADFYLSVASSTGTPAARFIKYDNDTTTANKFIDFVLNQGNNGSGQINANGASQAAFGTFSDIRLKENIQDLPPQLSNICALRPVEFDYKDGSGHQIGFIAQEMQQVYPDVVGVDRDEMLTVTGWDKTTSRLVKAIQEQQTIIESLTARIAALESKGA